MVDAQGCTAHVETCGFGWAAAGNGAAAASAASSAASAAAAGMLLRPTSSISNLNPPFEPLGGKPPAPVYIHAAPIQVKPPTVQGKPPAIRGGPPQELHAQYWAIP